jgi:DNA-binding MarR family transcriptional regulator
MRVNDSEFEAPPDRKTETAARLALVVGRLNRRMLRPTAGLSLGTLSALSSVVKFGPLRLSELAQREGIAAATITRIVAHLESRGLVAREVDPTDGRAFAIEATAEGIAYILRARSDRADVIAKLLETVDEANLDALERALPVLESLIIQAQYGVEARP